MRGRPCVSSPPPWTAKLVPLTYSARGDARKRQALPIYLKRKIYTMPQFLEQRFDHRVRTVLAVFWLGVYVFYKLIAANLYLAWEIVTPVNTIASTRNC